MVSTFAACLWALIALFLGGAWGILTMGLLHAAREHKEDKEDMRKMEELERRMFDKADFDLFAPISQKLTQQDLIGKPVYVLRKLQNRGGEGVSPGTIATIKCPCCGQYTYITGVKRDDLSLVPEHKEDDEHDNN